MSITLFAALPAVACLFGAAPASADATVNKVVVIGLDGTMYKKVQEAKAPNLLKLAAEGTLGQTSIAPHTTISGPSWATVLTGVWDTKHGIYDNNVTAAPFAKYPTAFTQLEKAKPALKTESIASWHTIATIAGSGDPHADVNIGTPAPADDPTEQKLDAATADAGVAAVTDDGADFLFTHLDQVDEAGHSHGSSSAEYLEAVRRVDAEVGKIVAAVDARAKLKPNEKWNIIVTADHGHKPGGGHGGQSAEETANFLIARGPAFKAGVSNTSGSLVDVTPTVLALLGVESTTAFDGKSLIDGSGSTSPNTGSFGIGLPNTGTGTGSISAEELEIPRREG
ncbi:alkaline phosphatase family protein [Nocardia yamanashiensis]|uniref:alkaline phosphatase family protein n=1 Tax=Nocardia yamanashiensis TaxID=209247 RepID=UPI001E53AC6F|nr:alkaline phosphatase family protein [Nocardia yamanashiensis]UGT42581.1 alkaline phosphatase family protein [Nocardia yamanashiensis]